MSARAAVQSSVSDSRLEIDRRRGPGRPGAPAGLQHPGGARVGEQERREVRLPARLLGDAALAMDLEQRNHDLEGGFGTRRPLEREADQVHPDERRGGGLGVAGGPDPFVADGDPVLVEPVLEAPQPGRARTDDRGRAGIGDGDVLRLHRGPTGPAPERFHHLHLTDRPVGVLGEQHPPRRRYPQRVAHVPDGTGRRPGRPGPKALTLRGFRRGAG